MKLRPSIVILLACLPFILWGVAGIQPTFDDYTTLQSTWWVQIADPGYFFPDAIRRPWDAFFGLLVGYVPSLFPVLNHILIILGHTANALLVYAICRQLRLRPLASDVAVLFFFFSPATLGATLACDGLNQTYAQLWGLVALWLYLKRRSRLWLLCVVMAALSKENGLAWAVVPPIVAYAAGQTDRRSTLRGIGAGLLVAVGYAVLFLFIYYSGIAGIEYAEEYLDTTWMSHAKDLLQLLAYTWMPADYASVLYQPTRCLPLFALTVVAALPFLLLLLLKGVSQLRSRLLPLLLLCFFILASPHLVSLVSIMHNYAPLPMAAMMVGVVIDTSIADGKHWRWTFALFLAAAIFTDVHHYLAARQSGQLSRRLATQALVQTPAEAQNIFCISIDDDQQPHYSNFYVRPVDAFAWGLSAIHFSHYTFKPTISEVSLPVYNQQQTEQLADSALQAGNDVVWVVGATCFPDSSPSDAIIYLKP